MLCTDDAHNFALRADSCVVIIVEDVKLNQRVALKLCADEEQWQREKGLRQREDGTALDGSHIIAILDSLVDEKAKSLSSAFPFVLVMPAAEQDLSDYLSHSRMAGSDWEAVGAVMRQVAEHIGFLHVTCNTIHADIKPRNIVKIDIDGIVAWVLIDLDAACMRSAPTGQKVTSSSNFPPELARHELDKVHRGAGIEMVIATENLDIWCVA